MLLILKKFFIAFSKRTCLPLWADRRCCFPRPAASAGCLRMGEVSRTMFFTRWICYASDMIPATDPRYFFWPCYRYRNLVGYRYRTAWFFIELDPHVILYFGCNFSKIFRGAIFSAAIFYFCVEELLKRMIKKNAIRTFSRSTLLQRTRRRKTRRGPLPLRRYCCLYFA
jgi:hypothetical protein